MERSVCRTSRGGWHSGATLHYRTPKRTPWAVVAWDTAQGAGGGMPRAGPQAQVQWRRATESRTNCFLGRCGPAHLFAATMNVLRPRPDHQTVALAPGLIIR